MRTSNVITQLPALTSLKFNKGFGPSVPQHTTNKNSEIHNESNEFVSKGKPLSVERILLSAERGNLSEPLHVDLSSSTR